MRSTLSMPSPLISRLISYNRIIALPHYHRIRYRLAAGTSEEAMTRPLEWLSIEPVRCSSIALDAMNIAPVTPDRIVNLGKAFRASKALLSAVELGVFTALA